jgi:hypothetical protein
VAAHSGPGHCGRRRGSVFRRRYLIRALSEGSSFPCMRNVSENCSPSP